MGEKSKRSRVDKDKRFRFSDDWGYVNGCARKRAYPTEHQARRTGRYQVQQGKAPGGKLWPYACPVCRQWHLTHTFSKTTAITSTQMREGFG